MNDERSVGYFGPSDPSRAYGFFVGDHMFMLALEENLLGGVPFIRLKAREKTGDQWYSPRLSPNNARQLGQALIDMADAADDSHSPRNEA